MKKSISIAALLLLPSFALAANLSAQATSTVDSSAAIQQDITGLSPQTAAFLQPAFVFIDNLRYSAVATLEVQMQNAQQKISASPKTSIVPSKSVTQDPTIQNPDTGVWYWVYNIYYYMLLVVRWLIATALVFYVLLLFLILYVLYRLYRRWRRPAWDR
jgi:hypothetical protein